MEFNPDSDDKLNEFAEALREFSPEKEGAKNAEQTAADLEDVKRRLEQERLEHEQKMKKEQQEFERSEQQRMEEEMGRYARDLEHETNKEREQYEKNLATLTQRRDDIIKHKKQKMKSEVEELRGRGASEEEQRQVLEQHERDLQNLVNRIDADRMRMKSTLQERLQKRREERLKVKQGELMASAEEAREELQQQHAAHRHRIMADEALTLNEALNIDTATSHMDHTQSTPKSGRRDSAGDRPESPAEREEAEIPASYAMAAPLNEGDLMSLLTASPLYQKLENIKNQIEKGAHRGDKPDNTHGDGFHDAKDSGWSSDSKLEPVDLNKLDSRKFIVYKFGCFVSELVAAHCQHAPVTLLLANKIPPNTRLTNNAYRNSFFFDANNSILYIRSARLDTVGEFVVVLVHALAHIKSGDLRNDSNPEFMREYQRALAVLCDDLFFARFRRSTVGSIRSEGSVRGGVELVQEMFGRCQTEEEKVAMVDDLLDVKLLPATNTDGLHFNTHRLKDRLSRYSNFSMTNKLHTMLGSMEDKLQQARAQGTTHTVDTSLLALTHKYSPAGSCPLSRKLPLRYVTANMSGHALWQTFANHADSGEKDTGTLPTPVSAEERYDELCLDFTAVNKAILDVKDNIRQLAHNTNTNKAAQKAADNQQLTKLRAELTKLEMEKQAITDKMNA